MAGQKSAEGQAPDSPVGEPAGGQVQKLGGLDSSGGILEAGLLISMHAAKAAQEDFKNAVGHGKAASAEDGLGDIQPQLEPAEIPAPADIGVSNLQGIDQHNSKSLQKSANVLKKINDTGGSIITSSEGGGGRGQPRKKAAWGILAALLFLGIAALVVVRFIYNQPGPPNINVPEPGPPDINAPVPGPPGQPAQYPPNPCALSFENPTAPEGIPLSGPLDVNWSEVPEAVSYELRVIPPAGAGQPWIVPTEETSKTIYMENFPAGGRHQFAVSALDQGGQVICTAVFDFERPAYEDASRAKESEGGGGSYCDPNGMVGC